MFNLYTLYVVDSKKMEARPLMSSRRISEIAEEAQYIKLGKGKRLVMTTNNDEEGLIKDYRIVYD